MEQMTEIASKAITEMDEANKNPNAPKELLMNEKDMAAYLGISRYFLTELRKKHGLKCLMFEGQHCIYYYLPVVDEYFRARSKGLQPETQLPDEESGDDPGNPVNSPAETDRQVKYSNSSSPTKKFPYKPMKAV